MYKTCSHKYDLDVSVSTLSLYSRGCYIKLAWNPAQPYSCLLL